jgi:hypothetical protein
MLLPGFCFLSGLAGILSSSLFITGTLYIAIRVPFENMCIFSYLHARKRNDFLISGSNKDSLIPKTVDPATQPWQFGQ